MRAPHGPSGAPRVPKDSTATGGPQGDSAILPWEYRWPTARATRRRLSREGASRLPGRLTPLLGAAYHPPDDERAKAPLGARRVCVPPGVETDAAPRPMERIPRSPDEADLPAQEATSRQGTRLPRPDEIHGRPPGPGRSAGSRSEASDGLTGGRGRHRAAPGHALPPARLRGAPGAWDDAVSPDPRRSDRSDGPRDDALRVRDKPGLSARRSSGTASGDGSAGHSG